MSEPEEEPPPFLGSWERVYLVTLVFLALDVLLFYLLKVTFS